MRDKFFNWLGYVTYHKYWLVLIISLVVTLVLGGFAKKIKVEATWMSLLPQGSQSVKSFQKILDEFGPATNIILAVEGPNKKQITQVTEKLVAQLKDLVIQYQTEDGRLITKKALKRIDHRYDIDFIRKHGLMLEKAKNLKKNKVLFTDYNLVPFITDVNSVYESQWVSDSDNLTKQEKEAERGLDGMFQLFHSISDFAYGEADDPLSVQRGVDALTLGDGYYLSNDKKMLLIFITPTISINEIEPSVVVVDSLDSHLNRFKKEYPDVHFGLTGMHVVMRDEVRAGVSDTLRNLTFAAVLILALFIFSFRMWSGPILAMLVLFTGIAWDIGIVQIVIGRLNIITVMCSVVLLGLGIDYAVHIISSYSELRHKGECIEKAIYLTYQKIGKGLLTGALTTSFAFLSLAAIGSEAFKEFGFVVGAGIICCLLSSIFLLPACIVAKEKIWQALTKKENPKRVDMEFDFLGKTADFSTARPWVTLAIALILSVFMILQIPKTKMNQNYMDLEPEGLESVRLQREIVKRFHMSPDNMMAIYYSLDEVNQVQDRLNSQPAVGMVESIASVLPSQEKQKRRLPYLKEIQRMQKNIPERVSIDTQSLVKELRRFSDNIIEISSLAYISGLDRVFDKANQFIGFDEDGNQVGVNYTLKLAGYIESRPETITRLDKYQGYFRKMMKERISEMSTPEMITLDMVPESYREGYVSEDGSLFLMAFYSRKDIWDGLFTSPFLKTMLRNVPNSTGSPVFMKEMVESAGKEGKTAFGIALFSILILLFADFRSLKTTLVALIPLLTSMIWLFGLMGLLDIRFTIVNVIGFPLLIGIGIDDGVHVIHRFKVERKVKLSYAISSIGKAILLTSVTTMLCFGSLVSSEYRGYIGLGLIVTIGIGLCFITSVIILPAILKLIWGGKKEHPEFFEA